MLREKVADAYHTALDDTITISKKRVRRFLLIHIWRSNDSVRQIDSQRIILDFGSKESYTFYVIGRTRVTTIDTSKGYPLTDLVRKWSLILCEMGLARLGYPHFHLCS